MKIEAITLREIQMPLVHFFEMGFGPLSASRQIPLTDYVPYRKASTVEECVVGEDPFYNSEWIETAWPTLTKYLITMLLWKSIEVRARLPGCRAKVRSHRMAKDGLENALWMQRPLKKTAISAGAG